MSPVATLLWTSLVTVFAGIFFGIVSPAPASSLAVLAGSVTLGALCYAWLAWFIRLGAMFWPFPTRQQRVLAAVLTLATMYLILMQSIGELSWRDAVAVIPLAAILYAYTTYTARGQAARSHQRH